VPTQVQQELLQHTVYSVLTSHNKPVPTTPYSPAGGSITTDPPRKPAPRR
jgi:hypothetical protein